MINTAAYVLMLLCSLLFPKEPHLLVDTWEDNGRHECFVINRDAEGRAGAQIWSDGQLVDVVSWNQTAESEYEQRLSEGTSFPTKLDEEVPEWRDMLEHASEGRAVESSYGPIRCIPTLGGYVLEFSYQRALVRPYSP